MLLTGTQQPVARGQATAAPGIGRARSIPLAVKFAIAFVAVVTAVLIINGAVNLVLNFGEAQRSAVLVQQEKARAAAEKIEQFVANIEQQVGWTTRLEWSQVSAEQRRYDFIRLQRQVPAITEVRFIDGLGKEQLKQSRIDPDVVGSGIDFSGDPRFTQAIANKVWYGPVYFKRLSEPYFTLSLAHGGQQPGVTSVEVNLKLIRDVVNGIRVGEAGYAFIIDNKGKLLAHPKLSLVLQATDLSDLPLVRDALEKTSVPGTMEGGRDASGNPMLSAHAAIAKLGWIVFVELPKAEAMAPVYRAVWQTAGLLGLGLLLATLMGSLLARRMVVPIRRLQEGAERLGAGDFSAPIDIRTGDEIETLASRFNDMAGKIQESYATLEGKVEARTRDLGEALEQQTATNEILSVISRSPSDLMPVLETISDTATRLCGSEQTIFFRFDGTAFRILASWNFPPEVREMLERRPITPGHASALGRAGATLKPVYIPDVLADPEYGLASEQRAARYRTTMAVPLLREGRLIGALSLNRSEPGAFTAKHAELVGTFADQAAIAIENVRLFEEVQARTRDLTEALQQQTATADVLKVISRSAFDLNTVLTTLIETGARLCAAPRGVVWLPKGGKFHLEACVGYGQEWIDFALANPIIPDAAGKTTGAIATATGQMVQVEDFATDPRFEGTDAYQKGNYRAALMLPLLRDGKVEGAIGFTRPVPGLFTPRQIELVQTFADQAVIAIQNVRLFDEVQARTKEVTEALEYQTATSDVLNVISRSPSEVQPVLDTIVATAKRLCGAEMTRVWMLRGDGFELAANTDNDPARIAFLKANPIATGPGSVAGLAVIERQAVHVDDVKEIPDFQNQIQASTGNMRTLLAVPLMREGAPIGVISASRTEVLPFTPRQIDLLKTFADQAVIAIGNARLFEEVQARTKEVTVALERQTATSEILRIISQSPTDTTPVFEAIALSAVKLLCCDRVAVQVVEGKFILPKATATARGLIPGAGLVHHAGDIESSFPARALAAKQTLYLPDWSRIDLPEKERLVQAGSGTASSLYVPMLRGGEGAGLLIFVSKQANAFDAGAISQAESFADQAVIAIGNARLFEEVQARTRDLVEALQQQTATADVLKVISRSAFDLQPVLDTLVKSVHDLCEAEYGLIWMSRGGKLHLDAHWGLSEAIAGQMTAYPIMPDAKSAAPVSLAAATGQIVHCDHVYIERGVRPVEQGATGGRRLTSLAVPLKRGDKVEGVITVGRLGVRRFSDSQVSLAQTFADQALIAIENARLFEAEQTRTRELAASLDSLRATQDRLIQSEKLASLGQLTAGIAHEIKNPLNFVNNFSDVSGELVDELTMALAPGKVRLDADTRAEVDDLTSMLKANLAKVTQHGRRADSIVKNMLLHSRSGVGERRKVDLNATVEESLNLAYHGARAEKPGFNITLEKSYDPGVGQVEIFPQEFVRVLLNLIANGFYAATKRKNEGGEAGFEPKLSMTTLSHGDRVEIRIRDNGTGIPDEVKSKMFNPFFTTKPAGEGTGLGLSLSFDIIKQHHGTIEVATEPGAFTEFTITLPRDETAGGEA